MRDYCWLMLEMMILGCWRLDPGSDADLDHKAKQLN
jgi:hypothetical protein